MPVYEYQCKACGREFEYQQRMSDPEKTVCEACGAEQLERVISRTAFQLKGSGWYKDLYSSSKPAGSASDGKAAGSGDTAAAADKPASSDTSSAGSSGTSSTGGGSGGGTGGGSGGGSSSSGGSSTASGS